MPAETGPHSHSGCTEVSRTATTPTTRNAARPSASKTSMRRVPRWRGSSTDCENCRDRASVRSLKNAMPSPTVPKTVSSATGSRTMPSGCRCSSTSRTTPPSAGRFASTKAPAHHARQGKGDGAEKDEQAEPIAVEGLMDQDRQGVGVGDAPELAALLQLVDGDVQPGEHSRRLRDAAEHEMDVGREEERIFLDKAALLRPPSHCRRDDAIGDEAVDEPVEKIFQVLGI